MFSQGQSRKRFEIEKTGDVIILTLLDKKILDEQNIERMGQQLFDLFDQGYRKMIVSFREVEYFSSSAFAKFITLDKKLKDHKGKLVFCDIDPQVLEVFEITQLSKLFRICRNERIALSDFENT